MSVLGPNTAARIELLHPNVILCGGEDPSELERCIASKLPPVQETFTYRCYRFWRSSDCALIWTGIGTGCLEPLLWEILLPGVIDEIILIGTAGRLPGSRLPLGAASIVTEAYTGGTSLDELYAKRPIHPRYSIPANVPTASIVSTDYYYGFSTAAAGGAYAGATAGLCEAVTEHYRARDLVDMETAQFYHFCHAFDWRGRLRFVSIKSAANEVENSLQQLSNSASVLRSSITLALQLLRASP